VGVAADPEGPAGVPASRGEGQRRGAVVQRAATQQLLFTLYITGMMSLKTSRRSKVDTVCMQFPPTQNVHTSTNRTDQRTAMRLRVAKLLEEGPAPEAGYVWHLRATKYSVR